MGLTSCITGCLLLLSFTAMGQVDRYMVFFSDKTGTPHDVSTPSTFLSPRAVERRSKANALVTEDDLPVVPSYVTQVRATGASAYFATRWLNGVLIEATAAQLTSILSLSFVTSVDLVAPGTRLLLAGNKSIVTSSATMNSTAQQLGMLTLDSMHQDGFRGEGIMVAVLDAGYPGVDNSLPFASLRNESRILMTKDFVTNSGNVYQFDEHGTAVLSIMAAETSTFIGGAPKADYLLFVTEDVPSEYRIEEYNWLFAAEQADSAGADIIQSSLNYSTFDDPMMDYTINQLNGQTAVISKTAGLARDRGIVVVSSAGNEGATPWQLITPPADVGGILAVGAVTISGVKAGFSSIGPTADDRIKPDVVALGAGVRVIGSSGAEDSESGTSMAAPLVSSLVAGLLQLDFTMHPQQLIETIRSSASKSQSPDNELGYGIPGYLAVKNFLDQTTIFAAYPNPAVDKLWISLSPATQVSRVSILDAMGRPVFQIDEPGITWSNSVSSIDLSGFSSGVYILRVDLSIGGRMIFRFVKL